MAGKASPRNRSNVDWDWIGDFASRSILLMLGALYISGTLWNAYLVNSYITPLSHWVVGMVVALIALGAQLLLLFGIPAGSLVCICPLLGVAVFTMALSAGFLGGYESDMRVVNSGAAL